MNTRNVYFAILQESATQDSSARHGRISTAWTWTQSHTTPHQRLPTMCAMALAGRWDGTIPGDEQSGV